MVEHQNSFLDSSSSSSSWSDGSRTDNSVDEDEQTVVMANATPIIADQSQERVLHDPLTLDGVETSASRHEIENDDARVDNDEMVIVVTDEHKVGAGVAGGVVGLLLGGPVLAALAGFGTAWATSNNGPTGDVARAMGHVALVARDKAKELNSKHNFTQQTQQAAANALDRVQEYERQNNVMDKTRDFVNDSWNRMVSFNREHHVVERTVEGVGRAFHFIVRKLVHTHQSNPSTTTTTRTTHAYAVVPENEPSAPPSIYDKTVTEAKPY